MLPTEVEQILKLYFTTLIGQTFVLNKKNNQSYVTINISSKDDVTPSNIVSALQFINSIFTFRCFDFML